MMPTELKFKRTIIVYPDGTRHRTYEMWIEDRCFGKGDMATLQAYYDRITKSPPSGHWKNTEWGFPRQGGGKRKQPETIH